MFINSPLWIVYDIIVGSRAGILDEIITECSVIVSILRYGWKNLDCVDQAELSRPFPNTYSLLHDGVVVRCFVFTLS